MNFRVILLTLALIIAVYKLNTKIDDNEICMPMLSKKEVEHLVHETVKSIENCGWEKTHDALTNNLELIEKNRTLFVFDDSGIIVFYGEDPSLVGKHIDEVQGAGTFELLKANACD